MGLCKVDVVLPHFFCMGEEFGSHTSTSLAVREACVGIWTLPATWCGDVASTDVTMRWGGVTSSKEARVGIWTLPAAWCGDLASTEVTMSMGGVTSSTSQKFSSGAGF